MDQLETTFEVAWRWNEKSVELKVDRLPLSEVLVVWQVVMVVVEE